MNIFAIGVTLFIGLLLFIVIANLLSKSRASGGHPPVQDDSLYHAHFFGSPSDQGGHSQNAGDWGGRDMSHHDHSSGQHGDTGSHSAWGGDTGGSDSGAGGGE